MEPRPIIGIIGGKGAMGKWFARFFNQRGYQVLIHDLDTALTLEELAVRSSVVIVSVPISVTCEVIKQVGPLLRPNQVFMDLTSLKVRPVEAMLKFSSAEVIGLHPLFGPDVKEMKGQNVVLCPARGEKWLPWLRELFTRAGAFITEATPERHDAMMSLVQGINHVNTILLGLVVKDTGLAMNELLSFSTPVFRTKLELVNRVSGQDPNLLAEIIGGNPHLIPILKKYGENWECLHKVIERGDIDSIANILRMLREPQV